MPRKYWGALHAAIVFIAFMPETGTSAAMADDSLHDLFFGTDLSVTSRFVYSGAVLAPMGGLDQPGLRIRAYGGAGDYKLDDGTWVDKQAGHLLAGWAFWHGDLGVTVYAGVAAERHDAPTTQSKHGTKTGASVLAEGWWRVDPQTVLSATAGYSDVYETVSGRIGVTREVTDRWGLIAEVRGSDDIDGPYWAAGAGITTRAYGLDAAVIAGASGDDDDTGFSLRAEIRMRR
ncbi:MAG: cellulose biosynthesis protein BcsS [Rhodobiaceae bacterium]|nr:cellulose biosynthesis protein BcsS [Rhodobiaceae bacterium]MCC0013477.1 cellulose biosynthesis protein BcsS [Rhodobiaceae bacterium]MCC0018090.1 cellulose biosynthesis protein BcsS [Rhodobiaceae bacterium]MCC0050576.1 cellulose biosynthesis protein BcsS [Rhodobiaceae bacterium]MCC0059779.1 cellulose biosynthesis protein BcsS [Rhodobiaceae bacterium]